jgi:hypothetical protein
VAQAKAASRHLSRERKRGAVEVIAVVQRNDTGHPSFVYALRGHKHRHAEIEHSLMRTEIEILMGCRIEAGERFGRTVCDGLLERDGVRLHLEADWSGKETRKQWGDKLNRFPKETSDMVLVAAGEPRMRRLIEWTMGLPCMRFMLFSTLDRLRGPEPWVDCTGRTARI